MEHFQAWSHILSGFVGAATYAFLTGETFIISNLIRIVKMLFPSTHTKASKKDQKL